MFESAESSPRGVVREMVVRIVAIGARHLRMLAAAQRIALHR
jgi:hypothetical protein